MEPFRTRRREEHDKVLLCGSLYKARDQHIFTIPHGTLPSASSAKHYKVADNDLRDELPHSCTTCAPVWHRVKDVVVGHEYRLMQLLDAAAHMLSLDALSDKLSPAIATLIDEFGGFKMTVATMHSIVARERFSQELSVTNVPQAIRSSCRLVVSTISSMFGRKALTELGKDLGRNTLLLGGDETRTHLDVYLNAYINEVVCVSSVGSPNLRNSNGSMHGFRGDDRYDGNVAIHAAVAAYTAGLLHLRFRRCFDESLWERCFASVEEARRWKTAPISVTILCVSAAMVDLCYEAVHLAQAMRFITNARDINISCVTADAVQEVMPTVMVLASPPTTSSWATLQCDSKQLVTAVSRCQQQLVITYIEDDDLPDRSKEHKDSVQVILDLQKSAKHRWTWTTMAPDFFGNLRTAQTCGLGGSPNLNVGVEVQSHFRRFKVVLWAQHQSQP